LDLSDQTIEEKLCKYEKIREIAQNFVRTGTNLKM
jgi:hypothetical protein